MKVAADVLEGSSSKYPSSQVSVELVRHHLSEMKVMYDCVGRMQSVQELYDTLLDIEASYVQHDNRKHVAYNFAHTVHQLHPYEYAKPSHFGKPLKEVLSICPYPTCRMPLSSLTTCKMHLFGGTFHCPHCAGVISYDTFRLAQFLKDAPQFIELCNMGKTIVILTVTPKMPSDGTWPSMIKDLKRQIQVTAPSGSRNGVMALRTKVFAACSYGRTMPLGAFSIDLVQGMFRQLDFINKICPHYEYWTEGGVIEAAIFRYERFIALIAHNKKKVLVPTLDIDLVWHAHQTMHDAYTKYSKRLAGRLINHDDSIGGADLSKGYAETFIEWARHYNELYSSFPPSMSAWIGDLSFSLNPITILYRWYKRNRWNKYSRLPVDKRFHGVDEHFPVTAVPYASAVSSTYKAGVLLSSTPVADEAVPTVMLGVIGTPVSDGRVKLRGSNNFHLMQNDEGECSSGCGYEPKRSQTVHTSASSGCAGGGCAAGGCAAGGCATGGCATGCGGGGGGDGGGCGGGCGGG